jgi:cyclopropane fatty-acyl-phospholipid synthase-like methyltransferase
MSRKSRLRVLSLAIVALLFGVPGARAFQLASRVTEEWIRTLERPERLKTQKVDEVIRRLGLKPGMVVADLGAGSGVFSRPLAKAVAPSGKVYAVDIQQGLLDYIDKRDKEEKIDNIKTVLGELDDPRIPGNDVELAFFNDVLHHIEHRDAYLMALARYIGPTGRIALIEMDKNDPKGSHWNQPELQVGREQLDQWMSDAGFQTVKEDHDLFPGARLFIIYGRKSAKK